ncbi:Gfo/Idh/MocA family oxidoreductase [Paenibacillus sp. 481]|uniref:Gfo/Idh/MocA family oxidoreductase n=1 Tax=Paenibacillus sp. 481 TaxID=2835869 RepID=UPI001E39F0DE|nr:Gfo/Idh/MocA family oxidoreductase [Paenibacillus sp. 481]UHA73515.1 Gfo/Idh/MocA family oxidoreductase [Paenibacillus sp. 481]
MKIAFVGCGTMGRRYAHNFTRMEGVTLVGGLAASQQSAARFAGTYGTEAFTSFDEIITRANPAVVCTALPTHLHKEFVLKAADCVKAS